MWRYNSVSSHLVILCFFPPTTVFVCVLDDCSRLFFASLSNPRFDFIQDVNESWCKMPAFFFFFFPIRRLLNKNGRSFCGCPCLSVAVSVTLPHNCDCYQRKMMSADSGVHCLESSHMEFASNILWICTAWSLKYKTKILKFWMWTNVLVKDISVMVFIIWIRTLMCVKTL